MTLYDEPTIGVGPLQAVRLDAALPAAGVYDVTPLELHVASAKECVLFISYIRGGAGGAVDFKIETSPWSANRAGALPSWFQQGHYAVGILAAGADTQSRMQREFFTYQATGAARESFVRMIKLGKGDQRLRISARESGNVGAPGTCEVMMLLGF